ncbi:MAG: ABC transporter ATP-binding protein [Deltaproteobacteria bacterium]|nr:ABC transporter ATP-binding protein [Deltaproteobacteria bacterium]
MYAVNADHLTKRYRIYLRPFDRLKEAVLRRPFHESVEALSDVSFQVPTGDSLGIIGENGAGKSTLLKILAGTVRPTQGNFLRQGRVAALLELGSGFHPEFSGRQNIYLNAALLGLGEAEIKEQEETIIRFAELESVIDRPVKTYSSGMYVRLGFSIATSVHPDVLIIDEALSVGDQRFQQKCVDRMVGFGKSGKTIIFCSHSMYLVNELCTDTLWLDRGRVREWDKTAKVVSEYLAYMERKEELPETGPPAKNTSLPDVVIDEVRVLNKDRKPVESIRQFETLVFQVKTRCIGLPMKGHLGIGFERMDGQRIFATTTKVSGTGPIEFSGTQTIELVIPSIPVVGGKYRAKARVGDEHALRLIHEWDSEPFGIDSERPEIGMVWMNHHWRFYDATVG